MSVSNRSASALGLDGVSRGEPAAAAASAAAAAAAASAADDDTDQAERMPKDVPPPSETRINRRLVFDLEKNDLPVDPGMWLELFLWFSFWAEFYVLFIVRLCGR
jgi:hypothetical protein